MSDPFGAPRTDAPAPDAPPRPPFLSRFWRVFTGPEALFAALAKNPAWFPVALCASLISAAAMFTLIPADVFADGAIEQALQSGNVPPEALAQMRSIPSITFKAWSVAGVFAFGFVIPVILAAVTYVIFVFIRGDNGSFKQHLCVVAHAGVINAVGAAVSFAVHGRQGRLAETLSVGSFLPFLEEGYLSSFLGGLDLFALWTAAVAGIGLAQLDARRTAGSTATVLLMLVVVFAAIAAAF